MNDRVFRYAIHVKGGLIATFVFEDAKAVLNWINKEYPKIQEKYDGLYIKELSNLIYSVRQLDGLKVGDECHVAGEGSDIFKIMEIIQYSPNRYGFVLDNGLAEEVSKCYSV